VFDRDRLDHLNLVDEAVTLGTLPPFAVVEPRQMVATVKIIPFAVPETAVAKAANFAAKGEPLLRVAAFVPCDVALIQTRLPGFKESILDKTRQVTEQRLAALGCRSSPKNAVRTRWRSWRRALPPQLPGAPTWCSCTARRSSSTGAT